MIKGLTENTQQLISIVKILSVAGFGTLYALGGLAGFSKGYRRFGGCVWIALAISAISLWQGTFSGLYLFYPLLLMASLTLGYGGEMAFVKLRKRSIYGLALGLSALPITLKTGNWILFWFGMALCLGASVVLGVLNPNRNARDEELLIGTLAVLIPVFMV